MEEFKYIDGFPGYKIDNKGNIWSDKSKKLLKSSVDGA